MLHIGDEIYVHGYIDEIREGTIIIKNSGGYFGTIRKEIKRRPSVKGLKALESLESEYKAYHTTLYPTGQDSDYWRGVRYALDVLGGKG